MVGFRQGHGPMAAVQAGGGGLDASKAVEQLVTGEGAEAPPLQYLPGLTMLGGASQAAPPEG